jgi:4-amino-4-deoxy-L-arabinose transferase-like glycosyltransferase
MKGTTNPAHLHLINGVLIAAMAVLAGAVLILGSVPPVDRDALTHHLAVPKLYLKSGGIHEIPSVPFSYYPMNLDLLYMLPMALGNDIFPKYIHFGFALLTAWLIFDFLRRRIGGVHYGLAGALLFLSLPVIIKLSTTVYVDLGLIFFSTAAVLQLLRWTETDFRLRHLVLAGIFAGLCLGTKVNGMLAVFLLTLGVPFVCRRSFRKNTQSDRAGTCGHSGEEMGLKPLGWAIALAVIAAMIYSPWVIRNAIWTGNPIYPMATKLFASDRTPALSDGVKGSNADTSGAEEHAPQDSGFGHFAIRKVLYGESLLEILAIPIRVFIQGQDDDPRLFDGRLNPYLLIFPLFAAIPIKGRKRSEQLDLEMRFLGLFALLYLVFAFFLTDMRIRYIGPIIPPLTILALVGIHDLIGVISTRCSARSRWLGASAAGVVFLAFMGLNIAYLVEQFAVVQPLSYLQGKVSRDEYILKYRPEYAALSFANRSLPEDARILGLFNGNRIYYSEREMICDNEGFRRAVTTTQSPTELARRLERDGFSHLLVRLDLFSQWADSQFKPSEKLLLQSFFTETLERVYHGHGYALFAIPAG